MCFALAATLWQKAALSLEGVSFRHPLSFAVLLGQWVWLLGLLMQIVGVVLQAAALDRGRVSIIQPLLVTTVIWALPLGYFLTHQTVGRREILGAAIIVVGLVGFASFGHPAAGVDDASNADWAISVIVIGLACVALLLFANRGNLSTRAAVLGTVAGMLYGLSATMMKPVVEHLHTDGLAEVVATLEFWIWATAGIVGFLFQQLSLSTGKLVPSVATVSVANPVVSVMLGALVLLGASRPGPAVARRRCGRVARRGTPRRGRRLVRPREGPGRRRIRAAAVSGVGSVHVRGRGHARRALQEASERQDRLLDRRPRGAARTAPPGGHRRVGLDQRALGHPHRHLDRLHPARLRLPGTADDPHGARLVRDSPLCVPGWGDVHARARLVRGRRRAQQLPSRQHRHVRHARDVRRDRSRLDIPRDSRGLPRPEDLLHGDRDADLPVSLHPDRGLVRLPVR